MKFSALRAMGAFLYVNCACACRSELVQNGTDLAMEKVLIRQLAEVSVQKLELGMSCCSAEDKSTGRAFSRDR